MGKFSGKNKWKLLHIETFERLVWAVSKLYNARKKYVNVESFSSSDIFKLLGPVESDEEGDIENIMNESDTEFVAEDESITFTNFIRKEEIGEQRSSVWVPESLIHILSAQSKDETGTLGQDEPNSAPATQRTSNQSPSPAGQRTFNQSPAAATQRSPASFVTRHTSNQSSKSSPPSTITLPKNTKKRKESSMIKDKAEKKKDNSPSNDNKASQKRAVSCKTKTKQRRKNQYNREMEMGG